MTRQMPYSACEALGICAVVATLTSGTVLHRTKIPLTRWFSAAYLMTTDQRGVSALLRRPQERHLPIGERRLRRLG